MLGAIVDDQGGTTTPFKQKNTENLKAVVPAGAEKTTFSSESSTCDPILKFDGSIETNAGQYRSQNKRKS